MRTPYKSWKVARSTWGNLEDDLNLLNDQGYSVRDIKPVDNVVVIIAFEWKDDEEEDQD